MRFFLIILLLSSQAFAQRASTILVEIVGKDHYELTISGLHPTVDRVSLKTAEEVQKFTGIETQPEIDLKSKPDWYRIWFYDGSDPYTKEGSVARIDFHFSTGKNSFTLTNVVPVQKQTVDAVLEAKAAYDPLPVVAEKLDPATKNKPNIVEDPGIIWSEGPAIDPKTDNPPGGVGTPEPKASADGAVGVDAIIE